MNWHHAAVRSKAHDLACGIDDDNADYLLADDNGTVGFLNIRQSSHPRYPMFMPREFAMIENAVVDQSCRGRGIGTRLFNAAIAWARERGLKHVRTMVWTANRGTREFYLRRGFKPMTEKLQLNIEDMKA